jgi:hypothetical protein
VDLQGSPDLPDPFPHSLQSDSGALARKKSLLDLRIDSAALVGHLQLDFSRQSREAHTRSGAAGMAVNVSQAFLHDSE